MKKGQIVCSVRELRTELSNILKSCVYPELKRKELSDELCKIKIKINDLSVAVLAEKETPATTEEERID